MLERIGLFGGTFDPIHNGHLRMALELRQRLAFDDMRLLPCHLPPHRPTPGRSSDDRLAMVRLALLHCDRLRVDDRELRRQTPSYTIDTLIGLRAELGPQVSLSWCVGMDSLATLDTWHRWRELLDYSHLVVVGRPGWQVPDSGDLGAWLRRHRAPPGRLGQCPAGSVVLMECPLLDISATAIRQQVAEGHSAQFLLPDTVWEYIVQHQLYRHQPEEERY